MPKERLKFTLSRMKQVAPGPKFSAIDVLLVVVVRGSLLIERLKSDLEVPNERHVSLKRPNRRAGLKPM